MSSAACISPSPPQLSQLPCACPGLLLLPIPAPTNVLCQTVELSWQSTSSYTRFTNFSRPQNFTFATSPRELGCTATPNVPHVARCNVANVANVGQRSTVDQLDVSF